MRESDPPIAWAHAYLARGWSVVPLHSAPHGSCSCRRRDCPSPAKHPRIRWEPLTRSLATPAQLDAWWERWPSANVGVVTGRVSGVVVLDVDPRNEGEETLRRLGLDDVSSPALVETGGGGRHLWFAAETGVATGPLGPGLDLKAEGGLVVAPPSLHASGCRYRWREWEPESGALAPLPLILATPPPPSGPDERDSPRTDSERAEFASAWMRAGISVHRGDAYYLCPFHPDHHPSLHIDADGCRWHCFGCGRGGGIGRLLAELGEEPRPRAPGKLRRRLEDPRPVTVEGDKPVDIIGEATHQDALLEAVGGRRPYGGVEIEAVAELVADGGDIAVLIGGAVVGRLSPEDAGDLAAPVAEARRRVGMATCRAVIRGGWDRGGDDIGRFGVVIYAPVR